MVNWIFASGDKDAIPMGKDERRFGPISCRNDDHGMTLGEAYEYDDQTRLYRIKDRQIAEALRDV